MIKINNLDKYYFKGDKAKEIHVVNHATLELPSSGLITFLGASGSGKTTLLNIIGGLDKQGSGSIKYDDKEFKGYKMSEIDLYRNTNFGYVFQNYLLLENKTVYENLEEALEIMNIFDKDEQRKRIEHTLKAVGLYKFRRKKVKMLSGGQMQRVSIARALLKNNKIIIADEPTGNVDQENTIAIMNILKKISEKTLVLLVTHEEDIASFYSDRIIKIKDGVIIDDYMNDSSGTLESKADRKIYLKDLNKEEQNMQKVDIELFCDEASRDAKIQVVLKNDTIYIKTDRKVINVEDSSVEFLDKSYTEMAKEDISTFSYDTSWYGNQSKRNPFKHFGIMLKNAFKDMFKKRKGKVIFGILYFILGLGLLIATICFATYQKPSYYSIYDIDDVYVAYDKKDNGVSNVVPVMRTDVVKKAMDNNIIKDVVTYREITYSMNFKVNYIESYRLMEFNTPRVYNSNLALMCGRGVKNRNEVVIGKLIADKAIDNFKNSVSYDGLLGLSINIENSVYEVVGITNEEVNGIYMSVEDYYGLDDTFIPFGSIDVEDYSLVSGVKPSDNTEIIVKQSYAESQGLAIGDELTDGSTTLKIVGTFASESNRNFLSVTLLHYSYNEKDKSIEFIYPAYAKQNIQKDYYEIIEGRDAINSGECIVTKYSGYKIGDTMPQSGLKVVGFYKFKDDKIVDKNVSYDLLIILSDYDLLTSANATNSFCFTVYNEADAKTFFDQEKVNFSSLKKYTKNQTVAQNKNSKRSLPIVMIVILALVILYSYIASRSAMLKDIKNIGVYRSIGKPRRTIVMEYALKGFAKTTLTGVLGYVVGYLVYAYAIVKANIILKTVLTASMQLYFGYFIIGLLVMYVINIIGSIIPILALTRKTPAEINSKYDI